MRSRRSLRLAIGARIKGNGSDGKSPFDAASLHIAAPMRPVFERLMAGLVRRGLLRKKEKGFKPARNFTKAADSAENVLRDYIERHPGHLPEALLCEGNCAELGSILRGEKDAVQVLFSGIGAELLDHFYGDGLFTSHWIAAIAAAVSAAAGNLPEGRGLRILEIGAGTGGLASQVLPLLERGLHSYTFSDVSAAFFSGAAQKLAAFSEWTSRFSISKNLAPNRNSKRRRSISSSAPTCCTPSKMCAPHCAICMVCSRRVAVSFSWIRPRRNFGPKQFSA